MSYTVVDAVALSAAPGTHPAASPYDSPCRTLMDAAPSESKSHALPRGSCETGRRSWCVLAFEFARQLEEFLRLWLECCEMRAGHDLAHAGEAIRGRP